MDLWSIFFGGTPDWVNDYDVDELLDLNKEALDANAISWKARRDARKMGYNQEEADQIADNAVKQQFPNIEDNPIWKESHD
jgi:cation transport regulator ChaB